MKSGRPESISCAPFTSFFSLLLEMIVESVLKSSPRREETSGTFFGKGKLRLWIPQNCVLPEVMGSTVLQPPQTICNSVGRLRLGPDLSVELVVTHNPSDPLPQGSFWSP